MTILYNCNVTCFLSCIIACMGLSLSTDFTLRVCRSFMPLSSLLDACMEQKKSPRDSIVFVVACLTFNCIFISNKDNLHATKETI